MCIVHLNLLSWTTYYMFTFISKIFLSTGYFLYCDGKWRNYHFILSGLHYEIKTIKKRKIESKILSKYFYSFDYKVLYFSVDQNKICHTHLENDFITNGHLRHVDRNQSYYVTRCILQIYIYHKPFAQLLLLSIILYVQTIKCTKNKH